VNLDELLARSAIDSFDLHFARSIAAVAKDERAEVLLALALVSREVRNGHVCIDLSRAGDLEAELGGALPDPERWQSILEKSPAVSDPTGRAPLVLSDGRLYLERFYEYEARLAAKLRAKREARTDVDERVLAEGLARLFPEASDQRAAAEGAVRRELVVVTGGPGTGKTSTVVKLVALLLEQAHAAGKPDLRIDLLAPTGKAAARLGQAIGSALASLPVSDRVRAAIPTQGQTIHRRLGVSRSQKKTRFRHHTGSPLGTDVVVVDEASMIDLSLATHLADALAPGTRLVLLGDKDQLASVEAGSVLADLAEPIVAPPPARRARKVSRNQLALDFGGDRAATISASRADSVIELRTSYRYSKESGIGLLAQAVNAGDEDRALAILTDARFADVALRSRRTSRLDADLCELVVGRYGEYLSAADPRERLARFDRFRVLCAHRQGPRGAEETNRDIESLLAARRLIAPAAIYDGKPVLVTRNDYGVGLFNGDVGIVGPDGARLRAWFVTPQGELHAVSIPRLPAHELVYAMTVHKSQGSEFDEVLVVLPDAPSPIVTRELLYTAITRARSRILIDGDPAVVRHAIRHRVERRSGLRDRLWR
jgi:exodeoxyribonuclease V alpha subunit